LFQHFTEKPKKKELQMEMNKYKRNWHQLNKH